MKLSPITPAIPATFDPKAIAREYRRTLTVEKQIALVRAMLDSVGNETDGEGLDILFHLDRADDALINAGEDYAKQTRPTHHTDEQEHSLSFAQLGLRA